MKKEQTATQIATAFSKDDIIANSKRLFNRPPEVVAGALYGVNGTITIEEAKARIDNFLAKPIKKEGGK